MARGRRSGSEPASPGAPLEPERLLQALHRGGVKFVVIGGFAALLHGFDQPTEDIDITPLRDPENLVRLATVLKGLDAVAQDAAGRDNPDWPIDDQHLRLAETTFLRTRFGRLDVVINPAGASGYHDLVQDAIALQLPDGPVILVATLERIISSKKAADRPKDHAALPSLLELLARKDHEGTR